MGPTPNKAGSGAITEGIEAIPSGIMVMAEAAASNATGSETATDDRSSMSAQTCVSNTHTHSIDGAHCY